MKIAQNRRDIVLFDLDGTVIDSSLGITRCVRYSMEKMGMKPLEVEELTCFIGPPLKEMFIESFHLEEEQAKQMVCYYRERYQTKGVYENTVYNKIPEVLKELKKRNYQVALATSKPELFAKKILQFLELDGYFDFIGGSTLGEERNTKAKVIAYVMEKMKIACKNRIVIIGDRKHDILGAKEMGIASIGVLYGFGSKEELENAGADLILEKIENLMDYLD